MKTNTVIEIIETKLENGIQQFNALEVAQLLNVIRMQDNLLTQNNEQLKMLLQRLGYPTTKEELEALKK